MGDECPEVYCWDFGVIRSRVETDGCKDKEDFGFVWCVSYLLQCGSAL